MRLLAPAATPLPRWKSGSLAKARTARCPDCGHDRETKAQPRTVLRCPNCGEHYTAPPLSGEPPPDPDAPLPVSTDAEMEEAGLLGPEVVKVDAVTFPEAEVHPPAADPPPTDPPAPDPVPSAAPTPATEPAEPPNPESRESEDKGSPAPPGDRPARRRRRSYARW